jgi:hypothetical protein
LNKLAATNALAYFVIAEGGKVLEGFRMAILCNDANRHVFIVADLAIGLHLNGLFS